MYYWDRQDYNRKYYLAEIRRGDELTGKEKALLVAKIKREKSTNLILNAIEELKLTNSKITNKSITEHLNGELGLRQVATYMKEFKDKKLV